MNKHGLLCMIVLMQTLTNSSPSWASGSRGQLPSLEEDGEPGPTLLRVASTSAASSTEPPPDWESLAQEPDAPRIKSQLLMIAHDRTHLHQWDAIKRLWNMPLPLRDLAPGESLPTLKSIMEAKGPLRMLALPIALNPENPNQWSALQHLWPVKDWLSKEHCSELTYTLREIAEDKTHPHHAEAENMLNPQKIIIITYPQPRR